MNAQIQNADYSATYSPEDNKIRLYCMYRLDDELYHRVKDTFEIIDLFACIAAILRRAISKPARYEFKHGKAHKFHALKHTATSAQMMPNPPITLVWQLPTIYL